jgi:glycosyltransferase involved in cell wall biosynthesis
MARLRVLHVVQNLNYGGMERLLGELVRLANPTEFDSHVLVLQYLGRFSHGLEQYATLHQCDPLPPWSMLWPVPMIRVMQRIAPDVVHSHSGVWYKTSLAAWRTGVRRVIHTEHGVPQSDSRMDRFILRQAARRTNVVVAVSEALAAFLVPLLGHRTTIVTVPNGVDTKRFRPKADNGALRRELGIPADTPIIGSIGRLEAVKGYDTMIEALSYLHAGWSGRSLPILVVAGDGSERHRLEQMAAARGTRAAVRLLGWRDDIDALHSAFTIFSLASRSEGTSVSLLEAMSAGLCPVVTDVGGNALVLGPELRHRLVVPGDAHAIAAAWETALADTTRREADEAAARCRVEALFGVEAMAERYQRLYTAEKGAWGS